jgi:hypothetical protein
MSIPPPAPPPAVPYATAGSRVPRLGPGLVSMLSGLALIGLGGCFLIGVLLTNARYNFNGPNPRPLTDAEITFEIVLYLLATACFFGALFLCRLGARLLRSL